MALIFFFIDGLGIGEAVKTNPVCRLGLWKNLIKKDTLISNQPIQKDNFVMIPIFAPINITSL